MKTRIFILLILLLDITAFTQVENSWPVNELDTARNVSYLSNAEKDVILEINKARYNPAMYAREQMAWMGVFYEGKKLNIPGKTPTLTTEGKEAYDQCMEALKNTRPVSILQPSRGMTNACELLVYDQGNTGKTGHKGEGNSTPENRINRFGHYYGTMSENIHYGDCEPRWIVISQLIDDGVKSRGHRDNILDPKVYFIGVAIGDHKTYEKMCVTNFATKFVEEN